MEFSHPISRFPNRASRPPSWRFWRLWCYRYATSPNPSRDSATESATLAYFSVSRKAVAIGETLN